MSAYLNITFFSHGKVLLLLACLIGICFLAKKKNELTEKVNILLPLMVFSLFYIALMSLQFINLRYSLTVLPLISLCLSSIFYYSFRMFPTARGIAFSGIILIIGFHVLNPKKDDNLTHNETLAYIDKVKNDQEVVAYLTENNYYDKPIMTGFLMATNLTFYKAGYLPDQRKFTNLKNDTSGLDLYVLTDYETNGDTTYFIKKYDLQLVKKFTHGYAWTKIYVPKKRE